MRGGCHFVRFLFRYILCVLNHDGLRFVDEVVKHRLKSMRKNVNVFQRSMFLRSVSLSLFLSSLLLFYVLLLIKNIGFCCMYMGKVSLSLARALSLSSAQI